MNPIFRGLRRQRKWYFITQRVWISNEQGVFASKWSNYVSRHWDHPHPSYSRKPNGGLWCNILKRKWLNLNTLKSLPLFVSFTLYSGLLGIKTSQVKLNPQLAWLYYFHLSCLLISVEVKVKQWGRGEEGESRIGIHIRLLRWYLGPSTQTSTPLSQPQHSLQLSASVCKASTNLTVCDNVFINLSSSIIWSDSGKHNTQERLDIIWMAFEVWFLPNLASLSGSMSLLYNRFDVFVI